LRAFVRLAAPRYLKAEAIVSPDQLVRYLGAHNARLRVRSAYNNQLMAMLWSSLARMRNDGDRSPRCGPFRPRRQRTRRSRDDIGWAIRDEDAAAVG
jgi:amylosucrase